jgi:hypothetical protein
MMVSPIKPEIGLLESMDKDTLPRSGFVQQTIQADPQRSAILVCVVFGVAEQCGK